MRYSEFNEKLYEFELQYHLSDIHIFCDGNLVGKVSKKCRYSLSTIYEIFEDLPEKVAFMLYENMMMLAETPLAEREEEKRYWLQKIPVPLLDKEGEKKWLWEYRGMIPPYIFGVDTTKIDRELYKTIFTESEIAQMDITGFVKEEVY